MRTSFSLSSLARASLVTLALAASAAQAVEVTVESGATTTVGGINYTLNPSNNSRWDLGFYGGGFLSVLNAQVSATGGATVAITPNQNPGYSDFLVTLPVSVATGESQNFGPDRYFGTKSYSHGGGLTISTSKSVASLGGTLSISNIQVDLASHRVYADIVSANGASGDHVWLWKIESQTSGGMLVTSPDASVGAVATLNALSLTSIGYEYVSQGLALTTFGKSALGGVTSFGTITTAVPEPSTWALTVAGMMGIAAIKRRRATTH